MKKRRLELALSQKQAADRLGVTSFTVLNWEKGRTEPSITSYPAIVRFLAYDPFPEPTSFRERLLALYQGILNDNLFEVMSGEIEEGRELYKSRVSPELYGNTNFYDRAIVDILVKSKGHIKSKIW